MSFEPPFDGQQKYASRFFIFLSFFAKKRGQQPTRATFENQIPDFWNKKKIFRSNLLEIS